MNRHGNIAFLMLPLVALLACSFAAFSYLTLDADFGDSSVNLAGMSSEISVMDDYIESSAKLIVKDYAESGFVVDSLRESATRRDLHIEGQGNFFAKVQNGDFIISRNGAGIMFEVKDVFIQSRKGENLWERRGDIVLEAGSDGEFIRFINK